VGQIARQHVDHRRGKGAALLIVTLADDQEMVAPVDRPNGEPYPGLSSIPPGSVAAACTADYACTIFPTKTLSDQGACGVTNRRGIKLCHQILTSN
jgi:hypothetical protein